MLADRPGVFGSVATALGNHGVSISAALQKSCGEGNDSVAVVVLTHKSRTADLEAALEEIKASGAVSEDPVRLRML
jgi:hypothetical protein